MEWILLIVGLVVGGGAGALIGYLMADRRARLSTSEGQIALAAAQQHASLLADQAKQHAEATNLVRSQLSTAEKQAATLAAELRGAQQAITDQKNLLNDAQEKLRESFSHLSAEALAKNNEAFLHLARQKFESVSKEAAGTLDERKAQIEGLLKPLNELLAQYQIRLGDIEKGRVESYSMLREQLGTLAEVQRMLGSQTNQLVSALRRPSTRGQWGELTLKRLVELAGMSDKCDFCEQVTVDGEDARYRPDMLIRLPGEREVVIDAKAALDAFLDASAAPDDDQRKVHMLRHSQQVRARARELATKAYWNQFKRSPEFVVMFLPGEAFLYAAVEFDPSLVEDCLRSRVIVATPTTLMALLKTIEYGWRQETITHNAEEVQKLGRELYERIAVMGEHFAKLGGNLESAVSAYNKTLNSIETRVLVTARKMSELGAGSDKAISDLESIETRPRELPASLQS